MAQKKRPTKKEKDEKNEKQKQQQEQMLTIGVGFALILFAVFGFFKIRFFRNIDCKRLSDHCRKYLPNPLSFISRIRILDCH